MADTRVCPQCGTENPSGQKSCSNCQTPLATNALFAPGQSPKHLDTGELEPMLPEWLRDARAHAKEENASPQNEMPPIQEMQRNAPKPAPASNMDFLAGLQSQAGDDDEEEVPDWLASITGTGKPKEKAEEPSASSGINWMEPAAEAADASADTPDWLAGLQSSATTGDEKDELTDFLRGTDAQGQTSSFESLPFSEPAASGESSSLNWFSDTETNQPNQQPDLAETGSFSSSNWFDQPDANANAESADPFAPSADSDTPDWMKQMSADAAAPAEQPQSSAFDMGGGDTPDWLKDMSGASVEAPAEQPQSSAFDMGGGDTPDWLKDMSGGDSAPFAESAPAESDPFTSANDSPSWLTPEASSAIDPFGVPQDAEVKDERAAGDGLFSDMPDWLRSAAPESTIFDEPAPAAPEVSQPQSGSSAFDEAPAFSDRSTEGGNDALFTEMPDWLSDAMESPATPAAPEPIIGSDALAPDVLPSWVEAMRPVDQNQQGMSLAAALAGSGGGPAESQGAFAGLSGVLPAGTGYTPTSKPRVHSIKLNASEDQLKQADILEQILAAENSPVALTSEGKLGSSRTLRWILAFIIMASAFLFAFMGTQIFSTPVGIPNELKTAVSIVQVIPPDAPVLVAFDYDPSRAGEMEAASAPLFDHMMILNHPRLTFVATNEYGTVLAERFISGPLAGRGYQSGVTYLNLGYLPGGHLGIRTFGQDPARTITYDISNQPAWSLPPLQGVTMLNQFAAIILITDDAESARAWVEQTHELRGSIPLLVVSSAQASPMIQPYYESGQVQGMVSGLYGGAIVERQYNNGSPGMARRYWDGYSIGMLIAALLVFGGGLLNLFLGMRDRAAAREE